MSALTEEKTERKMVGYDNFVRHNPFSDKYAFLDTQDSFVCIITFVFTLTSI